MRHEALLALIGDLYHQIAVLTAENAALQEAASDESPDVRRP